MWLLDPDDLTVSAAVTTTPAGPPGFFAPAGVGPANVQNTDINANLNAGTTVVLSTASGGVGVGNISINAPINKTAGGAAGLGFFADGSITLGPGIGISSTAGNLDVTFNAVNGVVLGAGSSISSNGGEILLSGSTFTNNSGPGALLPGAGRWLIFSNDPATNVFGGLVSTNQALWGQTLASLPPGAVPAGNNFIFASAGANTPAVGALTVVWRVGDRTGQLEIQPGDIDPDLWVVQEPQSPETNNASTTTTAASTSTGQSTSTITVGNNATGVNGGTGAFGAASTPASAASPPPTKLSATGFSGVLKPGNAAPSRPTNGVNQPVVLAGIDRAAVVGTTGGGAAVIAAQARGGTTVRLVVTVAPNDSFEISLPPTFLGAPNGKGTPPQTEAVSLVTPLPDWIVFDRATMKFSAVRVPAVGALPVTVKLRGASGKSIEVRFQ
jgi:hypothetical protein